jgi:hypothetical protein
VTLDDTQDADVILYLIRATTALEETLRFLGKDPLPAKDSKRVKSVILLDDMLVEPPHGCSLPLTILLREKIQWSANKFSEFTQAIDDHLRVTHGPAAL